jgi:predicted O-methyltransferase YrrM
MMFDTKIQAVMDRVDHLRHEVNDHWQIPRDEAELLAQIVRIGRFASICEIGTSYGYSTLHLAAAAAGHGGRVHTFDIDPRKVAAAGEHLREAGLDGVVTQHEGDARTLLATVLPEKPYDFVFFDATKDQSMAYWEAVRPRLAPRAALLTDNTITHADELAAFRQHLRGLPGAVSCGVPVGNGFELTLIETR